MRIFGVQPTEQKFENFNAKSCTVVHFSLIKCTSSSIENLEMIFSRWANSSLGVGVVSKLIGVLECRNKYNCSFSFPLLTHLRVSPYPYNEHLSFLAPEALSLAIPSQL